MFSDCRAQVKRLHVSRPDPFALFVALYIPKNWRLREHLIEEDFEVHPLSKRVALVRGSFRRLTNRRKVAKVEELVPVLLGRGTPNRRVEHRPMLCYWPTTVLDEIAKC